MNYLKMPVVLFAGCVDSSARPIALRLDAELIASPPINFTAERQIRFPF